jgi:hypothetical protein
MLNANQLSELIISPALSDLLMYSKDAVELLLFTCAVESNGGSFIKQINGPALGIYQMEPKTYADIWDNYINNKNSILMKLIHNFECNRIPSEDRLIYDLRYATAITRIHYERVNSPLPKAGDIDAIYEYYKKYYNTSLGKADYEKCISAYNKFKAD